MESPVVVVERYFDAWTSKDFATARSLLHDDLVFSGPIETLDNADSLMTSLQGLARVVTGAERRAVMEKGDEVCVVYDLHTIPVPTAPVAELYRVHEGKIVSMEAIFDARPFAAMFGQET